MADGEGAAAEGWKGAYEELEQFMPRLMEVRSFVRSLSRGMRVQKARMKETAGGMK